MAHHRTQVSSSLLAEAGISYALGPIDEAILLEEWVDSSEIGGFRLLVPEMGVLSERIRGDAAFRGGAAWGYRCGYEEETYTPVQVANLVTRGFQEVLSEGCSYAWVVGFAVGVLSAIAEVDRLIARVGMAHLCFLLSLVPDAVGGTLWRALQDANCWHGAVLGVYRAQVRAFREQGVSSTQAWRLALCPQWQAV